MFSPAAAQAQRPAAFSGRGGIPHRRYLRERCASPRAPVDAAAASGCVNGVSRPGAMPGPTVTVRMKEKRDSTRRGAQASCGCPRCSRALILDHPSFKRTHESDFTTLFNPLPRAARGRRLGLVAQATSSASRPPALLAEFERRRNAAAARSTGSTCRAPSRSRCTPEARDAAAATTPSSPAASSWTAASTGMSSSPSA
jgi:hypothetical protein